jgi:glycosyltransferase involved in cell wall biosynthesis
MKVLHLISSRGLGGAERVALELCKNLKLQQCEPVIGVIENSHNPRLEVAEEAKDYKLDTVIFPCRSRLDLSLISRIREYIRAGNIDLVNSHGYKSNFYGLLACGSRTPIVATNHNWLTSNWKLRVYCYLDSVLIRYCDRIVAVSEGIRNEMMKYRVPRRKIRVIDNGIDGSRFSGMASPATVRAELGLDGDCRIVGTVGSLTHEKGQVYLLQAAREIIREHARTRFLFVGDGPLRPFLERESDRLGIRDHVVFAGHRKDVPAILSAIDIFALPSVKEGLPMVLLEAMASRKPVIASRVGAIPKVIDGQNGVLVDPGDVAGLRLAITTLLVDDGRSRSIAAAGYEKVRAEYSAESMSRKYHDLYQEVIA